MKGIDRNANKSVAPCRGRLSYLNDRELIDRVIAGETKAEEEFVTRFRKFLYRLLQESNLQVEEHEDMVHQILLHLWENNCRRLRQWRGDEQFLSWLRRVVRNLMVDYWRNSALRRELPYETAERVQENDGDLLLQQIYASQQAKAVANSLPSLSALDAELIIRRFYRGQEYREMASACHLPVGHLGVAFHRARRRLKKLLCREHPELFTE